jgi:iron complex transport system ATP-binding protein
MKLNTGIENITAEVKNQTLVIWSKNPLKILSSALLNGGLVEANGIINVQVPEGSGKDMNDMHWSGPENFLINAANQLQLSKDKVVGLMTAAKMKNVVSFTESYDDVNLAIFVTAGATVAVTAGEPAASKSQYHKVGTINIVVVVDGNLTDGSMVEVVKTATEAKTVAIRELDIRSRFSGDLATGTLTDSVAVACTKKGAPIQYAGTFTIIGELIGKCVREGVKTAIYKQENIRSDRSLVERLADRCLSLETIILQASDGKITKESPEYLQLKKQLELILSDGKIVPLVIAALRLDEDFAKGLMPKKSADIVGKDLFVAIVESASKCSSGAFSRFVLDKPKPEDDAQLGPFTMCVLHVILKKASSPIP